MGLNAHDVFLDGEECLIRAGEAVRRFLIQHRNSSPQAAKDVRKVGSILRRLSEYGPTNMKNTEQFRHEGRFATGGNQNGETPVYAVKSYQLRVYGGFVSDGRRRPVFVCVECAVKKKQKADKALLERVARVLGEVNG